MLVFIIDVLRYLFESSVLKNSRKDLFNSIILVKEFDILEFKNDSFLVIKDKVIDLLG